MKKKQIIFIALCLLLCLYLLWENTTVGVTQYSIEESNLSASLDGFRIAHVSDLHNSSLWKQTITLLHQTKPDVICITGDLVDSRNTNVEKALLFAAEAVKIAPCYYVTGNHELRLPDEQYDQLIHGLRSLGVWVLDNEMQDFQVGQARIAVTGASWGSYLYQSQLDESSGFTLLLSHAPEEFDSYASAGFDLVLTGHAHGGQFRIPFAGGVFAPGQGIFPKYDSGVFTSGNTKMVVSRGVGNSIIPVRVFNRPELIILELKSA
jgi:predicted MPP superfamily phosphohydrolase